MNATLWITNRCNLRCKYCYEGEKLNSSVIQPQTIEASIDFLRDKIDYSNELTHIRIHGGEPLLYFDLLTYIVNAYKKTFGDKVDFEITTNATLLTPHIASYLLKEMAHIGISIDGASESHNKNRVSFNGEGTYDIVTEKIKLFPDLHNKISARMTITPDTVSSLTKNVQHLVELGFTIVEPVPDVFISSWSKETAHILHMEYVNLAKYQSELGDSVKIYGIDAARHKVKNSPCNGGITSFHIDSNGDIYPCMLSVGNKEYCLGTVYKPGEYNYSLLQEFAAWDKEMMEKCSGCSRYHYCDATRCKLINYMYTGDKNTPIPMMCAMTNIQYDTCAHFLQFSHVQE
ncbi:MAG: radical SAM protein [Lachnospiraceae bacterium]|nr:radical SAM protein [Lachnospiraceae bacterium]